MYTSRENIFRRNKEEVGIQNVIIFLLLHCMFFLLEKRLGIINAKFATL